eukprot:gene9811-2136_t
MITWKKIEQKNGIDAKSLHSSVIYEDQIFIFGGETNDFQPDNTLYIFNLKTKNWNLFEIPLSSMIGHSCVLYKKKLYFYGGWLQPRMYDDICCFDLSTKKLSQVSYVKEMGVESKLCYHSSNIYGDCMIVFGGCSKQNYGFTRSNELLEFSFDNSTLKKIPTKGEIPKETSGVGSVIYKDQLFIHGGYGIHGVRYNSVHKFDLKNFSWKKIEATGYIPIPKSGISSVYYDKKMICFGGGDDNQVSNELYEFDLETYRFKEILSTKNKPSERKFNSLSIQGDDVFLFGGTDGSSKFNCMWMFSFPSKFQRSIIKSLQKFNDIIINVE